MMITEGAVELLRHGFSDSSLNRHYYKERCLRFRVAIPLGWGKIDLGELGEALEAIGGYNDFNPQKVKAAFEGIKEHLSPYPGVEVGREGSPVLYVYAKDDGSVKAIMEAMRSAHADEVDQERDNCVRAWWD